MISELMCKYKCIPIHGEHCVAYKTFRSNLQFFVKSVKMNKFQLGGCLAAAKKDKVWYYVFRNIQVYDPVHQIETYEANGKQYTTVFVYI